MCIYTGGVRVRSKLSLSFLSPRMRRWLVRAFRYLGAAGVSALFIWLFLQKVDFSQVGTVMKRANVLYIVPVAVLFMLSYLLQAVRWQHLVRHIAAVALRDAFPRVLVSNTAGIVLPFQLGQVLMVQISAEKFDMSRTELFGAEFISRMMDGLVFAIFLAVSLATLRIGTAFTALTAFMLFGTLTGFALAWAITRAHPHLLEHSDSSLARWLRHVDESVLHPFLRGLGSMQNFRQTRDVFLLSLATWGTEAGFYWMVGLSLGLRSNPLVYLFLVAAAGIGGGIPLAQAGVGFIFLAQQALVAVGVSLGVATAYALSLQALIVAPIIVLGPLAVYTMHLTWRDVLPFGNKQPAKSGEPAPQSAESVPKTQTGPQ